MMRGRGDRRLRGTAKTHNTTRKAKPSVRRSRKESMVAVTFPCSSSRSGTSSNSSGSSNSGSGSSGSGSSSYQYQDGDSDEESYFPLMYGSSSSSSSSSSTTTTSSSTTSSSTGTTSASAGGRLLQGIFIVTLLALGIFGILLVHGGMGSTSTSSSPSSWKSPFLSFKRQSGSPPPPQQKPSSSSSSSPTIIDVDDRSTLEFDRISGTIEVTSPDYGPNNAVTYLPWDAVAEVYREQNIKIVLEYTSSSGKKVSASDDDVVVNWQILGQKFTGSEVTFNADAIPGVYECTVTVSTPSVAAFTSTAFSTSEDTASAAVTTTTEFAAKAETVIYTKTFTMAVKYIRREVRSLTDEDRDRFFDALKIFYSIDNDSGKKKYGEKFNNAQYFLYKHLDGAGRSDCDHWHDGAGFVSKHLAFTLEAEQALQAIDQKIAMPYWEYFQDAYLPKWSDSDVFKSEWYGEANPLNEDHAPSGIWQDVVLPDGTAYKSAWSIKKEGSLNPFTNAYGMMRSPWNNNPSRRIGRHNSTYGKSNDHMPNCKVMSECYASSALPAMVNCLNGVTHGPVHVLIGGAWGDGETFADSSINFLRNINKVLYFKNLWRTGYTRCPTECKTDEPCRCAIPKTYLDEYDVETILRNADLYDMVWPHIKNEDDEYRMKILRAIEDPGVVGELLTSAAPYDPAFWPIHGQLERVLGLKRARASSGDIEFDETWGFGQASGKFLAGVCDWSRVESVDDLTLPKCDFTGETACLGHGEDDPLEFTNFRNLGETYTNKEFFEFVHPWSDSLPYTYDRFDFDYCEEYGVTV